MPREKKVKHAKNDNCLFINGREGIRGRKAERGRNQKNSQKLDSLSLSLMWTSPFLSGATRGMYIEVQAHDVRPPAYACFARKDAARFSEGIQQAGGKKEGSREDREPTRV